MSIWNFKMLFPSLKKLIFICVTSLNAARLLFTQFMMAKLLQLFKINKYYVQVSDVPNKKDDYSKLIKSDYNLQVNFPRRKRRWAPKIAFPPNTDHS